MDAAARTVADRRRKPADTPDTLVAAHELGRVVDLDGVKQRLDPRLAQTFVDHMLLGDELAYDAWLALRPLKIRGHKMLAQALDEGIDAVENAPAELVRLFEQLDTVPEWVDWDQLRCGAIAIWRAGRFVPICLGYSSIGFGFSSYGGTKALNFTRLLIEEDRAGQRMAETLRWVAAVTTPDGMRRAGQGFKYSVRVRLVHCAVRFGVSRSPKWQWNEWGLPITNTDLFFTTSKVFCANLVSALELLGIRYTEREKEDIFALWRYIAYVMGVPEELNHVDQADSLAKNEIVVAVEREPDEACRILLHSLIKYSTSTTDGYQPLPLWLIGTMTQRQKLVMSYGLLRHLTSDEFCERMGIPDTRFKHVVKAASAVVNLKEVVTRRLSRDDERKAMSALREINSALAVDDEKAIAADDEVNGAIREHEADLETTMRRPVQL
ncbi:oxygenase MpaB family protein [Nocardia sp. R7R-8]|uniref:oxygenase MpaB family protein n=1 Tax=Nocardia sp. R7R-8 TaxID=3459304 RepID=UPI00403DA4F2